MKKLGFIVFFVVMSAACFAQKSIDELLADLKKAKPDTAKVSLYNSIANYYNQAQPKKSPPYIAEGLKLSYKLNYKRGIALMLTRKSRLEEAIDGNIKLGINHLDTALQLFKESGDLMNVAHVYMNLSAAKYRKRDFEPATKDALQSLKIYEKLNYTTGMVDIYYVLGFINQQTMNLDKAIEYFAKGVELGEKSPVSSSYIGCMSGLGIIYGMKGDMPNAAKFLNLALGKSNSKKFGIVRATILTNLGKAYIELKQFDKAKAAYLAVLKFAVENSMVEMHAMSLLGLAVVADNPAESIPYFNQALALANKISQSNVVAGIYTNMIAFYKKQDDYKSALAVSEKMHTLQDSIYRADKSGEIANLQSTHDLANSKLKVKQLEVDKYKSANQRNVTLLVAGALLIIIVVITLYYKKLQELNKLLQVQKEDLNKLNTIKDKIFSIIGHDLRGPMASISSTLYLLEKDILTLQEKKGVFKRLKTLNRLSYDTLNKLLYWGSSQLKGIYLSQVMFRPADIMPTMMDMLHDAAEMKQITVVNKIPQDTQIYVDPNHFEFIIRNLLHNSLKFTNRQGNILVSIAYGQTDSKYVTFVIKDDGVGMLAETVDHLFEDNYISTTGTNKETGTGLGLMLCKEFIEENSGHIWAESKPGEGAEFFLSFLAHKPA